MNGKFLYVGDEKLYVRGVTYGTFRPSDDGSDYPEPQVVEADFATMAANGVNALRTYTRPPRWLLDAAERHGLFVMVGLPWEQHVAFLDDRQRCRSIEARVRADVRACAGHPAVLCYAVGNEIPGSIVRWHGRRRVERFIERLYRATKDEDPDGLVTYVNYPTTEYLQLPFLDFACFNVYLESEKALDAYLARLHNLAGDRPLVMAEIGLDSRRNGELEQARVLGWQVRSAFGSGCAGAFLFSWTDEWHRGGYDIEDWDFGLTDRMRRPKPALAAVREAFAEVPFPEDLPWPRISVVVCAYNAQGTLADCLQGLQAVDYPDFEVIVVNDGSTDATEAIAREYAFRLINTENRGLSSARNTGMEAVSGEIVAYLDSDARPDPQWLRYLAASFLSTTHAGIGGPNLAPAGDGRVAEAVGNAPGGPTHVLLTDREAEHIPGCNMAVRKDCLEVIGGFDPQFRVAGDDVDACWRLQQRGWTLGFSPAAVVWHHSRNSLSAYLRQQRGYGRAEALLERKWPEKYNGGGHVTWQGRIYGRGLSRALSLRRQRVYHGTWGTAPFQPLHTPAPGLLGSLPLTPEWHLMIAILAGLSALGSLWSPLLLALPLLVIAIAIVLAQAWLSTSVASFPSLPRSPAERLRLRGLTALLYTVQPLARLWGRVRFGLTPWRKRGWAGLLVPHPRAWTVWSEHWKAAEDRLALVEADLMAERAAYRRGGECDRWDLEVRGGMLGAVRLRMAIEEHGGGHQLLRFRSWPRWSPASIVLIVMFGLLSGTAAVDGAPQASALLGLIGILLAARANLECAAAAATCRRSAERLQDSEA